MKQTGATTQVRTSSILDLDVAQDRNQPPGRSERQMSIRDKLFERANRTAQKEIKVSTEEAAVMRSIIYRSIHILIDIDTAALHYGTWARLEREHGREPFRIAKGDEQADRTLRVLRNCNMAKPNSYMLEGIVQVTDWRLIGDSPKAQDEPSIFIGFADILRGRSWRG
ncbi:MAG: hypothetical protein ACI89J_004317 [Hyphomicrobiaceae bacterium]